MAQLDRLLAVLVQNRGATLRLHEDEPAALERDGATHPVTKQALSGVQVVALLREVAPGDAARLLDQGAPATFHYATGDGAFVASASNQTGRWLASVALANGNGNGHAAGHANGNGASRATEAGRVAARERIETLLRTMVQRRSSDLHLRVGDLPVLRVHGELERVEGEAMLDNAAVEEMLDAIFPDRNRAEFAERNDTDFAYEIEGVARFRGNALRDRRGAAAVFRVIPATMVTVEEMGISPEVQALCNLTKGLVLVTGPTGSGKSTTLCALVDLVNRTRTDHIITIEDPIEFVHENKRCLVTQRQVGVHTGSFKTALRAALREDPDIVLVGELRDLETASIAIETAETGHLVFATLHTTTAAGTIDRIIDQFPADRQGQIRVMLSESLKGVISQVLCKKIGGGRVAAREVLLATPAVSNMIREGKTFQITSVMQTSRRQGMITLNDALLDLVESGQVEPKEALNRSVDKVNLAGALKARGHDVGDIDPATAQKPEPPSAATQAKTPPRPTYGKR
jgi:twitching motility protein PilT